MVDWAKRIHKAAGGVLHAGEEVLGAAQMTPSPFAVVGAGMTGGLIAGGVLGAAVGAAWDKRQERKTEEEDAVRPLPQAARRQARFELPAAGALVGVTPFRILVFGITGMGKARDLVHEIPIGDLESVTWQDADTKWMRGSPRSKLVWMSTRDDRVVAGAMIAMGPAGKANDTLLAGIEQLRPGITAEFAPPSAAGE